ncbi:MAG: hypothetical protein J1E98_14025 [Lachnospiraceae bacterium]|nr:hypothetical protein [Lachnospiraceae bacterium]
MEEMMREAAYSKSIEIAKRLIARGKSYLLWIFIDIYGIGKEILRAVKYGDCRDLKICKN